MRIAILVSSLLLSAFGLSGQYKTEASVLPADIPAPIAGVMAKDGVKISDGKGQVLCELWLRSSPPPASATKEDTVTWVGVAQGTLIGVIRFPAKGSDRRGQPFNAGTYTMRLSFFPVNGDHQGVAPQRDFLVLSKIEEDLDPAATPNFDTLVAASRKVSGTPHPVVFSMWKVDNDFKPGFEKMGDADWALQVKGAGTNLAIILIGKVD